jgi:hypothetical protein
MRRVFAKAFRDWAGLVRRSYATLLISRTFRAT